LLCQSIKSILYVRSSDSSHSSFGMRTFDERLWFFPSCLVFRAGFNFALGNFARWR